MGKTTELSGSSLKIDPKSRVVLAAHRNLIKTKIQPEKGSLGSLFPVEFFMGFRLSEARVSVPDDGWGWQSR